MVSPPLPFLHLVVSSVKWQWRQHKTKEHKVWLLALPFTGSAGPKINSASGTGRGDHDSYTPQCNHKDWMKLTLSTMPYKAKALDWPLIPLMLSSLSCCSYLWQWLPLSQDSLKIRLNITNSHSHHILTGWCFRFSWCFFNIIFRSLSPSSILSESKWTKPHGPDHSLRWCSTLNLPSHSRHSKGSYFWFWAL